MLQATRAPAYSSEASRASRWLARFDERWPGARRSAGGLALALMIEGALFLAILTLGQSDGAGKKAGESLTTIDFAPDKEPEKAKPEPEKAVKPTALPRAVPPPRPDQPSPTPPPIPLPPAAVVLPTARTTPAAPAEPSRIKAVVRDDMAGPVGPPDTGSSRDSQVVDRTASGDPIYAARWYREPTEQEMRGYLSTADPGWALINCKTEPGYRVDQCVLVEEWPGGSGMGRAVLASAWQLKVRPPQKGGRSLVGEWVRIRISYEVNRR